MPQVLAVLAVLAALVAAREARKRRHPARAAIVSPPRSTVIARDGAVRSLQAAELTLDAAALERLWTPENLENLAILTMLCCGIFPPGRAGTPSR